MGTLFITVRVEINTSDLESPLPICRTSSVCRSDSTPILRCKHLRFGKEKDDVVPTDPVPNIVTPVASDHSTFTPV